MNGFFSSSNTREHVYSISPSYYTTSSTADPCRRNNPPIAVCAPTTFQGAANRGAAGSEEAWQERGLNPSNLNITAISCPSSVQCSWQVITTATFIILIQFLSWRLIFPLLHLELCFIFPFWTITWYLPMTRNHITSPQMLLLSSQNLIRFM